MECYQNTRKTTPSKFNMLFSLCSDSMSVQHCIRTQGKQHFLNSTCCFPYVLIIFHADMLSEHNENKHSKSNVSETNVITTFCTEMLSEPIQTIPSKPKVFATNEITTIFTFRAISSSLRRILSTPPPPRKKKDYLIFCFEYFL